MPRVAIVLVLFFSCTGKLARAEEPTPLSIWRALLASRSGDEQMDLTEDLLVAESDPERLAAILVQGREYEAAAPGWQERTIRGANGKDRPWLIRIPKTYDAARPHAALVVLHDLASRIEPPDRAELERTASLWTAAADGDGMLLVLPTARRGEEWWAVAGSANLSRIVREMQRDFNVDENRILVAGVGDGADGVYATAMTWPSPFAGFVPLGSHPVGGGRGGFQVHLRNLGTRPMFAVAFEKDETVSPGSAPAMLRALARLQMPFVHRTLADSSALAGVMPEIRNWMRDVRRDPPPSRVFWEGNYVGTVDWIVRATPGNVRNDDDGFRDVNPSVPPVRPLVGFTYDTTYSGPGIRILSARPGTAAGDAGLVPGDVIVALDEVEVRDIEDFRRAVVAAGFGKKVKLRYRRGENDLEGEGKLSYGIPGPVFPGRRPYGSLRASVKDNAVDVFVRRVASFELRFLPGLFDLSKPIVVRVNGDVVHEKTVEADRLYMVEQAVLRGDRTRIPRGRLLIRLPGAPPGPGPTAPASGPVARRIMELLKSGKPTTITDGLLALIEKFRGKEDLAVAYTLLFDRRYVRSLPDDPHDLAKALLRADPTTTAAWPVLDRCRQLALDQDTELPEAMALLRVWVRALGEEAKADEELTLASTLLAARLDLDEGLPELARPKVNRVIESGKGSSVLREAAEDLLWKTRHLAVGAIAPDLRLEGLEEGTAVRTEDLEGRALLVLFDAGDDAAVRLRDVALLFGRSLPAYEVGVVSVPLTKEPLILRIHRNVSKVAGKVWHAAAYDDANAEAARAWGVHKGSAMFLVGPGKRVLKNTAWDLDRSRREAMKLARGEIGTPLPVLLRELRRTGWTRFRELWRGLAAGRRPLSEVRNAARSGGERGVWALRLAAATRGERVEEGAAPSSTLHGRLVDAWCKLKLDGESAAWSELVAPLAKKSGDDCLTVLDAIFDLGLDGEAVREALEAPAIRWRDWRVVSMALRGLSHQDAPADPRSLLKRKKAKRWQVRLALAEALEGYRHQGSVDALVGLLGDRSLRVRGAAAVSLEGLTGRDLGVSQKRWTTWRRGEGRGAALIPRRRGTSEEPRRSSHEYATDAYFGLKIASRKIAFVLDKSQSMYYGLFDRVVEEVEDFLGSAGPTTSFTVVEFADEPHLWAKTLTPANDHNIGAVASWLRRNKPDLATNIMDSMEIALAIEGVDTVVLLSDGMPNRGRETDPRAIVEKITSANRYARVSIHTIWMTRGRWFAHDAPRGENTPPVPEEEHRRRRRVRETADRVPVARLLMELAARGDGTFGVAFADGWAPPPGSATAPDTDK